MKIYQIGCDKNQQQMYNVWHCKIELRHDTIMCVGGTVAVEVTAKQYEWREMGGW